MAITRRQFLTRGAAAAAGMALGPHLRWLRGTNVSWAAGPGDAIVVFVQLFGGNDGVNTVYPLNGAQRMTYAQIRPTLKLPDTIAGLSSYPTGNLATTFGASQILDIGANLDGNNYALHPAMQAWHQIYQDGELAVVTGVHYPFADYSHFRSEKIYYGGDPIGNGGFGWFGKYLNTAGFPASDVPGVMIGAEASQLFTPTATSLFAFRSFSELQFPASEAVAEKKLAYRALAEQTGMLDPEVFPELVAIGNSAVATIDKIGQYYLPDAGFENAGKAEALLLDPEDESYGSNNPLVYDSPLNPEVNPGVAGVRLARDLRHVAATIRADVGARFFHVSLGGFDSHTSQENGLYHSHLLYRLSEALGAFWADMKSSVTLPAGYDGYLTGDLSSRVLIVTLSEFGRTTEQNAGGPNNAGTDHATSAPQFVIGSSVVGGQYGSYPPLADPTQYSGDLRMNYDFRDFYGTMLERWLGAAAADIGPGPGKIFAATTEADEFGNDYQVYTPIPYLLP